MCTVSFLPLSASEFILTHNRDEHHTRSVALPPETYQVQNKNVIYPKDEQGGGTWFATSKEVSLCLLNGGFKKHISIPPYRHSRGKIILDFFSFNDLNSFINNYDVNLLEPFTLLIINHQTLRLDQLVLDNNSLSHSTLDNNIPHIWSSTTLYNEDIRIQRKNIFNTWCDKQERFTQEAIIKFHLQDQHPDMTEGIRINREGNLFTVSLTSVASQASNGSMLYHDFINDQTKSLAF